MSHRFAEKGDHVTINHGSWLVHHVHLSETHQRGGFTICGRTVMLAVLSGESDFGDRLVQEPLSCLWCALDMSLSGVLRE